MQEENPISTKKFTANEKSVLWITDRYLYEERGIDEWTTSRTSNAKSPINRQTNDKVKQ